MLSDYLINFLSVYLSVYLTFNTLHFFMKKETFSIRFFLKRNNRSKKSGLIPIYCRVRFNKKVATDFSTNVFVDEKYWSSDAQKIIEKNIEHKNQNRKLHRIHTSITDIYEYLASRKEPFTAQMIRNLYLNPISVIEVYQEYNEYIRNSTERGTYKNHSIYLKAFRDFLTENDKENISIVEFSKKEGEKFKDYLLKSRKSKSNGKTIDVNYASKILSHLYSVMDYAVTKDYILSNPLEGISIARQQKNNIVYLDDKERETLENFKFIDSLQWIVDIFILQYHTGLAYSDLGKFLENPQIYLNYDNKDKRYWISQTRTKTRRYQSKASLPLLEKPKKILEKYDWGKNIDFPTNQHYNRALKQIAFIIGIEKNLSTHSARHTFAMMALNEWEVSIEVVSKMLGHKSVRITEQSYAKVLSSRVRNEMKNIK